MNFDSSTSAGAVYPDLAGKVAVVTGGSKGIGAAACRQLAANGAKVAVVARDSAGIDALVGELRAGGAQAIGFSADVTEQGSLVQLHTRVAAELGPTDIVMAFAGGFFAPTPFLELTEESFRAVIDWNLTSTFLTLKEFLPEMVGRRSGSIVTMSSCSARFIDRVITAPYSAAKAGVELLTQHVAREMAPHQIRINAIAPGTTVTERLAATMTGERRASVEAITPLGRLGTADDSAAAALFLASRSASWITGVTLDVAGGRIML
jgi:3-oxoacyl-[acyl-carrier protein] reductase